jgi:hypothetical protein
MDRYHSGRLARDINRTVLGIAPSNENVVYFLSETPGSGLHTMYGGADEYNSLWKYTYVSGNGAGANGTWDNPSEILLRRGDMTSSSK